MSDENNNEPEAKTLATPKMPLAALPIGEKGVRLENFEALFRFAKCVAASPFAPKGMTSAEAIVPAIQLGLEVGLSPMASLQNIAVINGRPSIYGDAALALVRASGLLAKYRQTISGEGDERTATVICRRVGDEEDDVSTFSVADAKKAGLWGKEGPWKQYPDRMLKFRARGFALRDNFGDVLKGLHTVEEVGDYTEKLVEGRDVSAPDINFGPMPQGYEKVVVETPSGLKEIVQKVNVTTQPAPRGPLGDNEPNKPKRVRRTKAQIEADEKAAAEKEHQERAESAGVTAETQKTADDTITVHDDRKPLEKLRDEIAKSPVTEHMFVKKLISEMMMEPSQKLENLDDDAILQISSRFMTICAEILDAPEAR